MTDEEVGDCFVVAGEVVAQFDMPMVCQTDGARAAIQLLELMGVKQTECTLVHGMVTRPGDGHEHTHAWVELDKMNGIVVDFSNGHHALAPHLDYYTAGKIEDTVRYNSVETRRMMVDYATYGPWHGEWA